MADKTQDFTETQYKSIPGQISTNESQGIVECFVAAMGNKDSVGDICLPGCFNSSLKRRKPRVVWGHNWNEPIGKVLEIYEVGPNDPRLPVKMKSNGVGGLFAKVQFNLKSERGREAFSNVQFFGEEQEWSIGYKTLDAIFDNSKQANMLKEVELYEVSPVLHGANQLTGTISIKADESIKSAKVGPCWPGYKQIGMKKGKNGNMVPNCVPIDAKVEKSALKDPDGGLTAAGRAHFKRTEGANLKPGVKGPANTPEKLRRKGSFLTRFFTNPSGPMKDEKGRPTRLALSARAWGEPVPGNAEAAAALAAKGRRLLDRYENSKEKSVDLETEEKNHAIYSIGIPQENPIIGRMGNLAKELALHFGGEVAVREADNNTIVFDIIKDGVKETMKVNYHTVDGEQFMFGSAQPVKVETIYLPLDSNGVPSGAPIPQSPNMLELPKQASCGCGGTCGSKQEPFSTWEDFKKQNPGIHMFIKTENMEMFEAANIVAEYHDFEVELLDNGFAIPNIDWYEKDAQEAVISALEGIEQKFAFARASRTGRGALRATRKLPKLQKPSTRDGDGDNFRSNARGEDVVPVFKKPRMPKMMPPRRIPTEVPEREEKPQRIPIEIPKPIKVPVKPNVPTPVKPPVKPPVRPKVPERTSANRATISGRMSSFSPKEIYDLRKNNTLEEVGEAVGMSRVQVRALEQRYMAQKRKREALAKKIKELKLKRENYWPSDDRGTENVTRVYDDDTSIAFYDLHNTLLGRDYFSPESSKEVTETKARRRLSYYPNIEKDLRETYKDPEAADLFKEGFDLIRQTIKDDSYGDITDESWDNFEKRRNANKNWYRTAEGRSKSKKKHRLDEILFRQLREMENDPYSPSGPPARARELAIEAIAKKNRLSKKFTRNAIKRQAARERMQAAAERLREGKKSLSSVFVSVADGNDIAVKTALVSNFDKPILLSVETNLIFEVKQAIDNVASFYKFKTEATDKGINVFGITGLTSDSIEAIANAVRASYVNSDIQHIDLNQVI